MDFVKPAQTQGETSADAANRLSAYDYDLPPDLIAQHPAERRDSSRLMHIRRDSGDIRHKHFFDLPDILKSGDLLVANDTRVIPARLVGKKPSGGMAEVFLSTPLADGSWEAMLRLGSGKAKPGLTLQVADGHVILEETLEEGLWRVRIDAPESVHAWLERVGGIPLPPYISRDTIEENRETDRERYQTIYARTPGAVAAPTAGLHFTEEVFARLQEKGVRRAGVTLHVGLGTFQPVREENLDLVRLHRENYTISQASVDLIDDTRKKGGRVVAVGTTTVRVLEHAAQSGQWRGHSGETRLFLKPGSAFKAVDALITNFHLPKSSLIMLVAAFAGKPLVDRAYQTAVAERYRFYSYGDAMIIE